jgi:hypothetical protein
LVSLVRILSWAYFGRGSEPKIGTMGNARADWQMVDNHTCRRVALTALLFIRVTGPDVQFETWSIATHTNCPKP